MSKTTENRSAFDWIMFLLIHAVLIGGISYAGFAIYGQQLGMWVAASSIIAGLASTYLYAKIVPGETIMKIALGIAVAANAAYMVHNGARAIGIGAYNDAQVRKYEAGMAAAAGATSKVIARIIGASAKEATSIEKTFGDGVSTLAALLAFLELVLAIIIFALASKRVRAIDEAEASPQGGSVASAPPYYAPPVAARGTVGFTSTNFSTGGDSDPKA